jgi:hypothetical protein
MVALTQAPRATTPEAAAHALVIFVARNDLRSIRADSADSDPRIERIERALAAYEDLAAHRTLDPSEQAAHPDRTSAVDHRTEFEAALAARDEAGYLGTTPAETIRALAADLRTTRQPVFSANLSVRTADGQTEITFCDGKYTFVLAEGTDYLIEVRRYDQPWSTTIVGPGRIVFGRAIGSLAAVVCDAHERANPAG